MKRWVSVFMAAAAAAGASGRAAAQEAACTTVPLKNPALTLTGIYGTAEKHARAWKADAVPAKIGNTTMGPLQPDGSSTAWALDFYSAQADSYVSIDTFGGTLNCSAYKGSAGRIPDLKAGFFRDGAALYSLAKKHGGDFIAQGYAVEIGIVAAPGNRHATWHVAYTDAQGSDGGLAILVDGNTGAVEKVLKR